jgi:hypothetical protein
VIWITSSYSFDKLALSPLDNLMEEEQGPFSTKRSAWRCVPVYRLGDFETPETASEIPQL